MKLGLKSEVTDYNREIYALAEHEDAAVEARINAEVYNLSGLAEDDDFGDRDGDNFGDYN